MKAWWKIGLVIGSTACFFMGFLIFGEEGLLWMIMGWILRLEFLLESKK